MTTGKKVARRKLSLLDLAAEMGNVSKACKIMGYSRQRGIVSAIRMHLHVLRT